MTRLTLGQALAEVVLAIVPAAHAPDTNSTGAAMLDSPLLGTAGSPAEGDSGEEWVGCRPQDPADPQPLPRLWMAPHGPSWSPLRRGWRWPWTLLHVPPLVHVPPLLHCVCMVTYSSTTVPSLQEEGPLAPPRLLHVAK